jgi:hypothetical protein
MGLFYRQDRHHGIGEDRRFGKAKSKAWGLPHRHWKYAEYGMARTSRRPTHSEGNEARWLIGGDGTFGTEICRKMAGTYIRDSPQMNLDVGSRHACPRIIRTHNSDPHNLPHWV